MHTYTVHTMINFRKYHVGTAENQNGTTIAQFFSSHGLVCLQKYIHVHEGHEDQIIDHICIKQKITMIKVHVL